MGKVRVTFYGVRGSLPTPGRSTLGFGGNTACIEVVGDGERFICEAGTGIRDLGNQLLLREAKEKGVQSTILISHLHWDHYIGLPFFKPLYDAHHQFTLCGPGSKAASFKDLLSVAISPPFFPIRIVDVPARLRWKTVNGRPLRFGKTVVRPFVLHHPGGSFGWRLDFASGVSVAIVTDNEPKDDAHELATVQWLNGVDLLVHDAQYTPEGYESKHGWGHSPHTYPLRLACEAGIREVVLTHFDPEDSDASLRDIERTVKRLIKKSACPLRVRLAREGESLLI